MKTNLVARAASAAHSAAAASSAAAAESIAASESAATTAITAETAPEAASTASVAKSAALASLRFAFGPLDNHGAAAHVFAILSFDGILDKSSSFFLCGFVKFQCV